MTTGTVALKDKAPTLHRFFFAVRPPTEHRLRIGAIRDALPGLRNMVGNERLHLTLGVSEDFADYPEALVARMTQIGGDVRRAPAEIMLDRLVASHNSIALRPDRRSQRLNDLAGTIGKALSHDGILRTGWRFSPHVTLGYRKGEAFSRSVATIGWTTDELELVYSLVGETRHVLLGRWPLTNDQDDLFG